MAWRRSVVAEARSWFPPWEVARHFDPRAAGLGRLFSPGLPPVCALAFGLLSVGQEGFHFLSRLLSAGGGRVFLRRAYSIVTLYRAAHLLPDPHQPSTADLRYLFPFRAESETPEKEAGPRSPDRLLRGCLLCRACCPYRLSIRFWRPTW